MWLCFEGVVGSEAMKTQRDRNFFRSRDAKTVENLAPASSINGTTSNDSLFLAAIVV